MNSISKITKRYPLWVALAGPLVAAAAMVPLRDHLPNTDLALIMVVAVALAVLPGSRAAALVAGVSAGVWFDFFLTRPYERFTIQRSTDIQTTVLLAVTAVLIGEIAVRRRQARTDHRVAHDEVISLYVTAEMLANGSAADQVVTLVAEQLTELLFLVDCRFDPTASHLDLPMLDRAGELDYNGQSWSARTQGLPNQQVVLPVESQGRWLGAYILRGPATPVPLSHDRRLAAIALSDLAGAALAGNTRRPPSARLPTTSTS
jgi:K+-sensing histidine kinase KdpD